MPPKLHHPELMKLRNRYHLARRHAAWPEIKKLVATDDPADLARARALARAAVASPPRMAALQAGSREARARNRAFLRLQRAAEQEVRAALADLSDRVAALLTRAAADDGTVSPGRLHRLLGDLKRENRVAYRVVNGAYRRLLRTAARAGLRAAMAVATKLVGRLRATPTPAREGDEGSGAWTVDLRDPALDGPRGRWILAQERARSYPQVVDKLWITPLYNPLDTTVQPIGHHVKDGRLRTPLHEKDHLSSQNDTTTVVSNGLDSLSNGLDSQLAPYKVLKEIFKETHTLRVPTAQAPQGPHSERLHEAPDDEPDAADDGPDPLRQTLTYSVDSGIFQKIFKGALRTTMQSALFGDTGVSSRVWDLRDQNFLMLKRLVANGIAAGRSAADIAAEAQQLLVQPAGFDYSYTGPGIYRSAWKNAMRLARTESNRAYGAANALYAAEKEWNVIWHVSDGQREEDECDDLDGVEMTPEEFLKKYPQHPQCLCYSTLAVPDRGDDEPDPDAPTTDEPA